MIILGIDPGSRLTGFAVIKLAGRTLSYIDSGVLHFDKIPDFIPRLGQISLQCQKLIEKYQPDEIAFESLIYVKNVSSLAKLAQARGAMIGALSGKFDGKIYEYSPNLIKSSVTGYGHAGKDGVVKGLSLIYGQQAFSTSDESDALAIATCHALHRPRKKILQESNP